VSRLCGPVVLVDHAAEYLPAPCRCVQAHDNRFVVIGWPLLPGLVRPVPVIVPGVDPQHHSQMRFAVDQHPVGALGPDGPHPAFGIIICSRRSRRRLHNSYVLAGKDSVERGRELGVAIPDEEPERADPVREVHSQVAGLLRSPCPVRVPGHPQDVYPPGRYISMTNSTYRRLRKIVSTVKKSHASSPSAWERRNLRQEVSRPRGAGLMPRARRIRRTVA